MKLTIVRGLPGSGKSTYARSLGVAHVETDMYFIEEGVYRYDATLLPENHRKCYEQVRAHLLAGRDCVVSNTFTRLWEMEEYLALARELGAAVAVIRMTTQYQSVHGVSSDTVAQMARRFEDYPQETKYPVPNR